VNASLQVFDGELQRRPLQQQHVVGGKENSGYHDNRKGGKLNKLTLLVLLDAFRRDYVSKTVFLRKCANQGAVGALREGFGFVPRAAYFGGLSVEQSGFTNMYCCDPARSPFGMSQYLPVGTFGGRAERDLGIRAFLDSQVCENLTPYASSYVSSLDVPLPYLPFFDPVEKYAPWDKRVGYHSLFEMLDERGLPWYQCSWPLTNLMNDHSDVAIVDRVLADLRSDHRFAFVHLQELDGVGHIFGPGSSEMQSALVKMDRLMERFVVELRSRFDAVNLMLFGDHGMVNVTRTIDVWRILNSTSLRFGLDFVFFIDSTMVRFWFYSRQAQRRIREALSSVSGGRVLEQDDLEHYGIKGCDSRNAEMIFLVDPGVLIFPNFFQRTGEPVRGMHGYDPNCPDNLGFLLLDGSELAGTHLGTIDAPEIFFTLCNMLGLKSENAPKGDLPIARAVRESQPLYTQHPDHHARESVGGDLARIVDSIRGAIGDPEAIVLTGSFGRDEGGVRVDDQGRFSSVNDYDIIVVDRRDIRGGLRDLENKLRRDCRLDFLDLAYSDGNWVKMPCTMFNFDLKYGSKVIYGNHHILDSIPALAAADIPPLEGLVLLLNRTAGILTGLRGEFFGDVRPTRTEQRYLSNQFIKAVIAVADWNLLRWGAYDSSYRTRWTRFNVLAPGAGIPGDLVEKVDWAFRAKLFPDQTNDFEIQGNLAWLQKHLTRAIVEACNAFSSGVAAFLPEALDLYVASSSSDSGAIRVDNKLCEDNPRLKDELKLPVSSHTSIRSVVYAALPLLLNAVVDRLDGQQLFQAACKHLDSCIIDVPSGPLTLEGWDSVRTRVIQMWFALIHGSA
jgi:hypothetical protein